MWGTTRRQREPSDREKFPMNQEENRPRRIRIGLQISEEENLHQLARKSPGSKEAGLHLKKQVLQQPCKDSHGLKLDTDGMERARLLKRSDNRSKGCLRHILNRLMVKDQKGWHTSQEISLWTWYWKSDTTLLLHTYSSSHQKLNMINTISPLHLIFNLVKREFYICGD